MPVFRFPFVGISYDSGATFVIRGGERPSAICGEAVSGRVVVHSYRSNPTVGPHTGAAYTTDNEGETWSPDYGAKNFFPYHEYGEVPIGFGRLKTLKDGSVVMSGYVNAHAFNIAANDKPWDSGD